VRDNAVHGLFPARDKAEQKAQPDRKPNRCGGLAAHGACDLLAHFFGAVLSGVQLLLACMTQL
jgi:hypothetical protein